MSAAPRKRSPQGGPLRVVIYARVSTDEQAKEGISLGNQPELVEAELRNRFGEGGYRVVAVLRDEGLSGSKGPTVLKWETRDKTKPPDKRWRPQLVKLFQMVEADEVDAVAVFNLSRLYRDPSGYGQFMLEMLLPRGLHLFSAQEPVDIHTPEGRLLANVLAATAGYQRESNNDTVCANLRKRKERRLYQGTPPYGWRYTTAAERESGLPASIVPISEELEHVKRAVELYLQGNSERRVAELLNAEGVRYRSKMTEGRAADTAWHYIRVRNLITNPAHAGLIDLGEGEYVEGWHHPHRAFDREVWERVMALRAQRTTRPGAHTQRPSALLSGLAKCAQCGDNLGFRDSGCPPCYMCRGMYGDAKTRHAWVDRDLLETAVLHEVGRLCSTPAVLAEAEVRVRELLAEGGAEDAARLSRLRDRQAELTRQTREALRQLRERVLTEALFALQQEEISGEQADVARIVGELEASLRGSDQQRILLGAAMDALRSFPDVWSALEPGQRHEMLRLAVESLEVGSEPTHNVMRLKLRLMDPVEVRLPRIAAGRDAPKVGGGVESLTLPELAALWHVLQGRSTSQGAAMMGVQDSTFSTWLGRAKHRLRQRTALQAARIAEGYIRTILYLLPLAGVKGRRGRRPQSEPAPIEAAVAELEAKGLTTEAAGKVLRLDPERVREIADKARAKAAGEVQRPSE